MKTIAINNNTSPNFGGMSKVLKKKIYLDGQKDISRIIEQNPSRKPVVGQLPKFIFDKLPVENRPEAIREILSVFDKVAITIRDYIPEGDAFIFKPALRHRPQEVNTLLTDVFRKYGVLRPYDDDIDVQYIDQGGKGKVFKLEGLRDRDNDDEFVIKVFHQIKGAEWHPFKSHGCYAEINNGMYWRQHEGHDTHRGKFFFASLGSGYIVSKFLDEDVAIPRRIVEEYKYGIKCTDEEKDGPLNGYNRIKGYNYDYGGMRVVNALKNSNHTARNYLRKIREMSPEKRADFWSTQFFRYSDNEDVLAGLTLGIKHLDNKTNFLDTALIKKDKFPKVAQAAAYVLKYLSHEEAVRYFEQLVQTSDVETQRILFNEIPLLAKRKDESTGVHDDINVSLREIVPERIYTYYRIAEKYALPETVEHLASFIHLLPEEKIKEQYIKLTHIKNTALQERLIWKHAFLPNDMQDFALIRLADSITDPVLQQRLLRCSHSSTSEEIKKYIQNKIDGKI